MRNCSVRYHNLYRLLIRHYKRECKNLEEVVTRILGPKLEKNILAQLMPKHTSTPTYYQLVKTHNAFNNKPRLVYQSFDVVALYTNVDTQRAVESCIRLLRIHHQELQLFNLSINDIEELLRTVVVIFRFRNRFYKQKRGLAMGSRLAPLLAIVFMDSLERQALSSGILYFGRYIDDIFIVGKTRAALRETFSKLNSAHESIQLTSEEPSPDGFLPFLNSKVRNRGRS
ncbi:hypothetical protein OSTOST_03179, partial [Ostertagia ostertagi]